MNKTIIPAMNDPNIIKVKNIAIPFKTFLFIITPHYHYNKKIRKSKIFKHILLKT